MSHRLASVMKDAVENEMGCKVICENAELVFEEYRGCYMSEIWKGRALRGS
jgi:hypothetical protein